MFIIIVMLSALRHKHNAFSRYAFVCSLLYACFGGGVALETL